MQLKTNGCIGLLECITYKTGVHILLLNEKLFIMVCSIEYRDIIMLTSLVFVMTNQ